MKKTKRIGALMLALTMFLSMPFTMIKANAGVEETNAAAQRDYLKAVDWIETTRDEAGFYGDGSITKDTCDVEELLIALGVERVM